MGYCEKTCESCYETCSNSGSGIRYEVFNNRCVKAKLPKTFCDAHSAICSILNKANPDFESDDEIVTVAGVLLPEFGMQGEYTAKATVNVADGDSFDIEIGKNLAKRRLLDKYHKDFDRSMKKALLKARTFVAALEHYCEKHNIDFKNVPSERDIEDKIYFSGYAKGKKN